MRFGIWNAVHRFRSSIKGSGITENRDGILSNKTIFHTSLKFFLLKQI